MPSAPEFFLALACSIRQKLRIAAITLALAGAVVAPPAIAAPDLTDIWWSPAEPGWGVNFVQADSFIFATFFVYGPTNKPAWYTGQMTRDANGIWKGGLYASSGSYFGAPFDPTVRAIDQVGSVTFTPTTESEGALTYNVGAVVVAKTIRRQTLQDIDLDGTYMGALVTDVYNCDDSRPVVTSRRFVDAVASPLVGGATRIDFSFATGGACSFTGTATQAGRVFRIDNATYTCGTGPATLYELKATSLGLEGRWSAPVVGGCTEYGVFSMVQK
jgi:hypothetical protein